MTTVIISHLRKWILLTSLILSFSQADTIGGEASLGVFNHSPSGHASYTLPFAGFGTSANIEDALGYSEEQDIFFKLYIEHFIPLLPNIKIAYSTLGHEGNGIVKNFTWGGLVNFTGPTSSTLSLDMTDTTLYYELLDNWAEVDMGLTLRYLSGDMGVNISELDFTTFIPMLYGRARVNVPSTDLSLQVEANAVGYGGLTSYDYEVSARYTLTMGIGLEAGYKAYHLDSNDLTDGFNTDLDFSGPYAAAIWDF